MPVFDKRWQGWVAENIERGCAPHDLVAILQQNHFSATTIKAALGDYLPDELPLGKPITPNRSIDYEALAQPRLIHQEGTDGVVRYDTALLQLYTIDHFMTEAECDRLVTIIKANLRPSEVTVDNGDKYFRTSSTADISLLKNPFVEQIDRKIAERLGINLSYSEGIQAQRYAVGQQFKPHTDYFEPNTEEYKKYASIMGNRTWTFMVYLTTTPAGGGTGFTELDHVFYPEKGKAVVWNNLYPDGNPNFFTQHTGMPVEEGEKIIITKWFREKGRGAMMLP